MKKLLVVVLVMLMAFSMFACGKPAETTPPPQESTAPEETPEPTGEVEAAYDPKAFAGTELVMLRHTGYEADWMAEQFPAFEEETGIKVTMEQVAYSDLHDKVVVDLSSGTGTYDVIATPDFWVAEYAEGGWLVDLNQFINNPATYNPDFNIADFPQSLIDAGSMNGEFYAFPWKFNADILYYRTDLMEAPETWDELLQFAKDNADKTPKGVGMTCGKQALPDVYNSILVAHGGSLLSEDASVCTLDSPEALEALNFLIDLNSYGVEGSVSRHWDETSVLLAQGESAAEIMVNTLVDKVTDPEKSQYPNDIGFAPLPKAERRGSFMNTWALAVTNACETPEAGWMLIQYLMMPDQVRDLTVKTNGGIAPSRTSVITDPELSAQYPLFNAMAATAADGAFPAPKTSKWSSISEIVAVHVQNALTGTETPEAALAAAKTEIDAILK